MATILVVDDRDTDRELLVTLLTYAHYRVIEAADGAEALRLVRVEHPDLVISDVLLPKMDGYELVRKLRLDPSTAQTTVIFYTAIFSEREAQDLAKKSGVAQILTKPTDPEKILKTVEEVLRVKGFSKISSLPAHFEHKHQELLIDKLLRQVEELHQSEERFRLLAENATDMVFRFRLLPTRAWEYVNPAAKAILGYEPQEYYADAELPFRTVHPESYKELKRCLSDKCTTERTVQIRWIHKEGRTVWTEIRNTPLYSNMGELVALEGISRDVTELKGTLEEIRHSRDELEILVQKRTADLTRINQALQNEIEERKKTEKALKESEKRLKYLSSKLLLIQEEERKLIAHDIHDSTAATLAAVKYKIEMFLKKNDNTIQLKEVVPILQTMIEDSRRIQLNLRPFIIDDLGILAAINWFCRESEKINPDIRIEKHFEIEEKEVPGALKIVIFRILQEAMNNISQHSQANSALISLRKIDNSMELIIQDNGRGFHEEQTLEETISERGLGLTTMKERAELSGGRFSIESIKGRGTAVMVTWPTAVSRS